MFLIPFVVNTARISKPIVGYNTIEHVVTTFKGEITLPSSLVGVIRSLSDENADIWLTFRSRGGHFGTYKSSSVSKEVYYFPWCFKLD